MSDKVTVSRDLLRQALDALCAAMEFDAGDAESEVFDAAVETRTALEQPAVKPYAWVVTGAGLFSIGPERPFDDDVWQPVYTAPPPPAEVPLLSEPEIAEIIKQWDRGTLKDLIADTEAAVRRKAGL